MANLKRFSAECFERCPELHSCVNEHLLRKASGEDVTLATVIYEHTQNGTLPETCNGGPIKTSVNLHLSTADLEQVAQATIVKKDAWGDLAAIACRAQALTGGGNIKPL